MEPIALGDAVQEVVPRLRQTLEQAEAHREFLRGRIEDQTAEITKIRRALQVFDPEYHAPPKKMGRPKNNGNARIGVKTSAGTSTGHGITVERCRAFVDEILKQTDGGKSNKFVTQAGVYKAIGADQTKASAAFRYLRQIEFLRKAGRTENGRGDNWAVMDKFAYDKALKALAE